MNLNQQIAEFFVQKGLIDPESKNKILAESEAKSISFYTSLLKNQVVDETKVFEALSEFYSLEFYNTSVYNLNEEIISKIPMSFIKDNRMIPFAIENNSLVVLIDEPYRVVDVDALSYFFDKPIVVKLVTTSSMNGMLGYIDNRRRRADAMSAISNELSDEKKNVKVTIDASQLIDAPTVKLTDSIIREATLTGASDIHIEPFDGLVRVRFRLDGKLFTNTQLPAESFPAILARFKIMASMDISERRIPQDGKITMEIDGRKYDYRVSTVPMAFGEKIVIRIFDTFDNHSDISKLGLDERQEKLVRRMISYPHGILLLTGPTGSGKTTSLYSFLKSLNKEDVNITTIEDPIENNISGVNQIQVNSKVNMTFAAALRAILRQDPNIIMIGEIRDEETAEIAVKAAITGHLVLSTLHTNSAHGTISRLVDMGIPKYLVADALIGAISQRLVRKLCPNCKKPHMTTPEEMKELGLTEPVQIYEPGSCGNCNNTGYHGRTGVFEILNMNPTIKKAIEMSEFSMETIYDACVSSGMIPLKEAAKKLVLEGVTSYSEYIALLDNDTEIK